MIRVFQSKKFRVGILTAPSSSLIKEFRARSADNSENREFIPRELPQACSKQPPSATMYTKNVQEVNVTRSVTKKKTNTILCGIHHHQKLYNLSKLLSKSCLCHLYFHLKIAFIYMYNMWKTSF